ncbi:hypothetical protein BDY19DRAFT_1036626 [Irpex rosettiformis]|uniref:Uncharacterized protein n=1 Tax=Irpex rosettiformis TaxID=378272 RepID=A0ACB8U845_9APHY|nr:hypothetical protein BDY19DRAFT_1036626 [Irpex rosettiformis]
MATEQSKSPEQQPPPPSAQVIAYPPPYAPAHYAPMPPGPYGQPIYTFAPMPADPNHDPNVPNGAPQPGPYIMAFPPPPGLVYAYAPPHAGQPFLYPPYGAPPVSQARPKRKQVKMACTNCAAACKRCDDSRPCERCQKYGIAESCLNGQRKERKKGIKRGPYKRKAKGNDQGGTYPGQPASGSSGEGEASVPPAPYPFPPQEGYYPFYYPPGNFAPQPHEHQPNGDAANGAAHPMPPPVFPLHPAVYPPYGQYPPGAVAYPPPGPATAAPSDLNGKGTEAETNGDAPPPNKKRISRLPKSGDDGKKKKSKEPRVESNTNATNGHASTPAGQSEPPTGATGYAPTPSAGNGITNGTEHRHVVSPV